MSDQPNPLRYVPPPRLRLIGLVALGLAAVIIALGVISRALADQGLTSWTNAQAVPTVTVISVNAGGGPSTLVLPGDVQAFNSAPIYARVSGYLKIWYTDIGARVKTGQVLGVIETPDLDQQLEQAKADLATARANESLAETTAKRWQTMLKSDSVSQQATDEKNGDLAAKQTIVNAASANVERLQALESFKRIVAPFDGVVTSRDTDVGALIDAGGGRGPQLFTVSDIHLLRVYVSVPQDAAPAIHPGMTAQLLVPGHGDTKFTAKVDSTSGSVNIESGTLLVELSLDDSSGALMPGDFANVRFDLSADANVIRVPASALIFRSAGLQVATVDATGRAKLQSITVKQDLGRWIEVASGIKAGDRIIDSPPDALSDGDEVHVAAADAPGAAKAAGAAAAQEGAGHEPD